MLITVTSVTTNRARFAAGRQRHGYITSADCRARPNIIGSEYQHWPHHTAIDSKMGLRDLLPSAVYGSAVPVSTMSSTASIPQRTAVAFSAAEAPPKKKIEMHSKDYYVACAIGGWMSCGLTHMMVTPLDVVKCNMQIDPKRYTSIGNGFSTVFKDQGVAGLFRGWFPTLIGYGFQGVCKFGFYEYFKKCATTCCCKATHSVLIACHAFWPSSGLRPWTRAVACPWSSTPVPAA